MNEFKIIEAKIASLRKNIENEKVNRISNILTFDEIIENLENNILNICDIAEKLNQKFENMNVDPFCKYNIY